MLNWVERHFTESLTKNARLPLVTWIIRPRPLMLELIDLRSSPHQRLINLRSPVVDENFLSYSLRVALATSWGEMAATRAENNNLS